MHNKKRKREKKTGLFDWMSIEEISMVSHISILCISDTVVLSALCRLMFYQDSGHCSKSKLLQIWLSKQCQMHLFCRVYSWLKTK